MRWGFVRAENLCGWFPLYLSSHTIMGGSGLELGFMYIKCSCLSTFGIFFLFPLASSFLRSFFQEQRKKKKEHSTVLMEIKQ